MDATDNTTTALTPVAPAPAPAPAAISILDQPHFPAPRIGRPWSFTPADWLAAVHQWETDPSASMMECCRNHGFTHVSLYDARDQFPELATRFARAREARGRLLAEQTLAIADNDANDILVNERGVQANNAAVRRAECRIGARQWMAERLAPAEYAPKQRLDITQRSVALNVNATPSELQSADSAALLKALEDAG